MKLRDYQQRAVDSIYAYFESGATGNPIVATPTASGKSVIQAEFIRGALAAWPQTRIVCLTHVRELIVQNFENMRAMWQGAPAGIYSASVGRRDAQAQILFAGIQTVYDKAHELGWIDLIIIDECFVADTMVATPLGSRPIQDICVGDVVANAFGYGHVVGTSKTFTNSIIEITDNHGNIIRCTERHPIFTDSGWIKAGELAVGSYLYGKEELRILQQRNETEYVDWNMPKDSVRKELEQDKILLNILRAEILESDVGRKHSEEDAQDTAENWTPAHQARRERPAFISVALGFAARAWRRMVCGSGDQNKCRTSKWRLPKCLQGRHRQCREESCDRDRRKHSLRNPWNDRSKENGHAEFSRVVSVSRVERESAEPVFNLHVEGHPSYFANGKLVHNCHLLPHKGEGQYRKFIAAVRAFNPHVKIIGLTATAYRQGQGMLTDGENPLFTDIILDLTQGEELVKLIDDGYLAPLHPKRTDLEIDISGVRTTAGEFNSGDLEKAVNTDENTHAAIEESLLLSKDRTSCLWFCAGVDHAIAVRDALRNRGEQCEMVAGNTPVGERERILADFKSRRLKHVTNANVLTTGFDHPTLDMIVLLRPTRSASLHVQMLGRGMRIAEGKVDCLVLDFAGNTRRLGPINAIRIPKKPGAGGASESPTKDCPICKEILATAVRVCPHCGHEFPPPAPQISDSAGTDLLIARAEDMIKVYSVDSVRYAHHEPPGKRPTMKVTYECGMKSFPEWVCIGHPGFAGSKAANWWMKRTPKFAPGDIDDALARADVELRKPLGIKVNQAGKYPEVIDYSWG